MTPVSAHVQRREGRDVRLVLAGLRAVSRRDREAVGQAALRRRAASRSSSVGRGGHDELAGDRVGHALLPGQVEQRAAPARHQRALRLPGG